MMIHPPTRITIEVHQPDPGGPAGAQAPIVRVFPDAASASQPAMAAPREEMATPASFDPGECHCLDAEDCNADHAND